MSVNVPRVWRYCRPWWHWLAFWKWRQYRQQEDFANYIWHKWGGRTRIWEETVRNMVMRGVSVVETPWRKP